MKADVVKFVAKCLICQQVKVEHKKLEGNLQPLPIQKWIWDHVTMDFIKGLLKSIQGHEAIWVIVDRLTMTTHFLPVSTIDTLESLS